jgi:hypothetical protein
MTTEAIGLRIESDAGATQQHIVHCDAATGGAQQPRFADAEKHDETSMP